MGRHGVVASGHYLGARAGQLMLDRSGNAIDAGVTAAMALCTPAVAFAAVLATVSVVLLTTPDTVFTTGAAAVVTVSTTPPARSVVAAVAVVAVPPIACVVTAGAPGECAAATGGATALSD